MSKRKPIKPSHGPKMAGPKIAAKTERAAQAIVRSPRNDRLGPHRAGSTLSKREALLLETPVTALRVESPPKQHGPQQEAGLVESPVTYSQATSPPEQHEPQQQALPVGKPVANLPDDGKQTMTHSESNNAPDVSSAAPNVWAYQARLLEMSKANMQFPFEFAQRLATIRSPGDFFSVIAEFTNKRIAMFQAFESNSPK